jgi:hypothetical protein
MRSVLVAALLSAAIPPVLSAQTTGPRPGDVASLQGIIDALYGSISGPAGQTRDWDRLRPLFIPGARLIPAIYRPDSTPRLRELTIDEYIKLAGPGLEKNGFFETEVARQVEQYGGVVHVFSTYDSRFKPEDPKPFQRGINSIQLFNDGKRWWIVNILWEGERPTNPIPPKYLTSSTR